MNKKRTAWFSFFFSFFFFSLRAGCLPETLIMADNGPCTHAALTKHHLVLSYDETAHEYVFGKVIHQQWHNGQTALVELIVEGERIVVSYDQQLYVEEDEAWIPAYYLCADDRVRSCFHEWCTVSKVTVYPYEGPVVYLTVAPTHTYCITPLGIVVHNSIPVYGVAPALATLPTVTTIQLPVAEVAAVLAANPVIAAGVLGVSCIAGVAYVVGVIPASAVGALSFAELARHCANKFPRITRASRRLAQQLGIIAHDAPLPTLRMQMIDAVIQRHIRDIHLCDNQPGRTFYECGNYTPEELPTLTPAEYEVAKSILRQAGFHVHEGIWVLGYDTPDPAMIDRVIIRIPGLPFYISKPQTEFPRSVACTQPQASSTPKQNNPPNDTKKDQRDNNQEKNNNDNNGPEAVGTAAVALLKSIDESKEQAAEVVKKTYEWITTTQGGIERVQHAFRANCDHNFGPLLARLGANINDASEEGVAKITEVGTKILIDVVQKLINIGSKLPVDARGVFENVVIEYESELITVRGCIHNGIVKMGTMFIQPQHVRK